jgi:hypothetical protein
MARWRPRRTVRLVSHFRGLEGHLRASARSQESQGLSQYIEDRYTALHRHCIDQSSQLRLGRLLHRLNHRDPGVQESALAELELATQLIRVGIHVTFLPESQARTADLECHLGRERFFMEVTAMVGSAERRRLPLRGLVDEEGRGEEEDRGVILIHRILARISQKARQLADYCDPVILSISIPRADLKGSRQSRREEIRLNLKHLAGAVTLLLQTQPHLSAVLIALWDVTPLPAQAATRLANVELVERTKHQKGYPRVRLLIENPDAATALSERQGEAFRQLL